MNAPELPKGYQMVESVEPEALDASAAMLADPKSGASRRMRKNMWALRQRVTPSVAPIVRVEDDEGKLHGYAWNMTQARQQFDVHLEKVMKSKTARQLLKIWHRGERRARRIEARISDSMPTKVRDAMREEVNRLRDVASSAECELRFERWGESMFKNPDGN